MKKRELVDLLNNLPDDSEVIFGLSNEGTENEITAVNVYQFDNFIMIDEDADSDVVFDDHVRVGIPSEFKDFCIANNTSPIEVLHGFIADLCELHNYVKDPRADGLSSNGSDERRLAAEYFERVGYSYREEPTR